MFSNIHCGAYECWRTCLRFSYALSFSRSSYHARMRPASTISNAIPRKSRWEKRNDVGRKFISWKQKYMRGTAKTRNLERIQKEELGILSSRSMQNAQKSLTQPPAAGKPENSFSTCLQYACGEAQRKPAWTEQNYIDRFAHSRTFLPKQYALQNATQLRSVYASLHSPKCVEADCIARSGNEQCGCLCCMFASVYVCVSA